MMPQQQTDQLYKSIVLKSDIWNVQTVQRSVSVEVKVSSGTHGPLQS